MDNSNLIAKKNEIVQTTNSLGWQIMKQMAEEVIAQMIDEAIDEEDAAKGDIKRREAKAAKTFWAKYLTFVERMRSVEDNQTDVETDINDPDFYSPVM